MTTRLILLLTIFVSSTAVMGQRVIDVDKLEGSALNFFRTVGGEPMLNTKFVRLIEGTPYFSDEWLRGNVFIEESEYRNLYLKVNIMESSLEFRDAKGETMVCTMPIKRVVLIDSAKRAQYMFVNSSFVGESQEFKKSWLLELASGKASLFKLQRKQINEFRPYGSATTEQRIVDTYWYYIFANNAFTRVKKLTDIPEVLVSEKPRLLEYIKANHLSAKDEKDMTKLVEYYNTL